MNNDGRLNTTTTIPLAILLFLFLFFPITRAALYPYGTENGDTKIDFTEWNLGSQEVKLASSMPLLGDGTLSSVWINTVGALTYRKLTSNEHVNKTKDNIIFAPYYVQSQSGNVYYREADAEKELFDNIEEDFESTLILPPNAQDIRSVNFRPTYALVVTWTDVATSRQEGPVNTFQAVLATDGRYSFVIYNYDDLQWTESPSGAHAAAGIYVSPNSESSCFYELPGSQTSEVSSLALVVANSGEFGRYILIISEPFECVSRFQTPCEEELPESDWGKAKPYFSISKESWDVYVINICHVGLYMRPNVSSERIDCEYESDYYDSTWQQEASKCLDLNATKTFVVETEIKKIGNDAVKPPGLLTSDEEDELKKVVEEAITSVVNLTDVIITITDITTRNESGPVPRSESNDTVVVTTIIRIPPYIHKKTTSDNISDIITENVVENDDVGGVTFTPIVTVTETTDKCLQNCMCRFRPGPKKCPKGKNPLLKPDSCCGGCNGKPYSSTIKACCNNTHIYDPKKARCCNGRVRKGASDKCP